MKREHSIEKFREQLLNWYDENRRILPWREDATPYRVWVSEIMLQQTRVEAVKPYFERFVKELPTLQDLSVASEDTLFKLWEGLGYYNRVMNMKKCAIECVEKHGGNLPSTYDELIQLPGIGAYTAGAIASIAYKQKVPAVDGNVLRVFSRVLISEDDILKESTKRKFQKIIMEYLPEDRSDAFNQALMEIGALICVPNAAPRCNICPVASECMGYQSGDAHRLPNKAVKKARKIDKKTVLVITYQNQVHLCQREEKGLLAGLYEFDVYEGYLTKNQIRDQFKGNIKRMTALEDTKHIFSHVEWHMKGYLIELNDKTIDGIWCTKKEIEETYAIPTAYKVYKKAWLEW
ncbi:A/G-specific adenine glycosylase [Erysipelotrichaceae bacterium HCN-30851]